MKIKFLKFLPIAAAVLLATSCSKDDGYERNVVVIKNTENNDDKKIETNDEKTPETNDEKTPETIVVTGITLDKTALEITVGETATLTASVTPDNATDKSITWSSTDETIATVDENGKVTAVAAGTVKITATAKDGSGVKGECEVTVTPITVIWDNMNNTGSGPGTYTQDGVTLTSINTADHGQAHISNSFYDYGDNTFSTTSGKFTKIEIICTYGNMSGWDKVKVGQYQPYPDEPDYWEDLFKLTWTGEAETVTIHASIFDIQSITFTIE